MLLTLSLCGLLSWAPGGLQMVLHHGCGLWGGHQGAGRAHPGSMGMVVRKAKLDPREAELLSTSKVIPRPVL